MTIAECLVTSSQFFERAGIPDARLESEFLLACALGISRPAVVLKRDMELSSPAMERFETWCTQRAKRLPLAYVVGNQPFLDFELTVTRDVLIPRPETELLAERAIEFLRQSKARQAVDVGTGSGALAIAMVRGAPGASVTGIDISEHALRVAEKNGAVLLAEKSVRWLLSDLLSALKDEPHSADLVVANLPYVTTGEWHALDPELHFEPRLALDGGNDGLDVIRRLLPQAAAVLKCEGKVLLEIGCLQAASTRNLLDKEQWKNVQVHADLAGLPRIVEATRR